MIEASLHPFLGVVSIACLSERERAGSLLAPWCLKFSFCLFFNFSCSETICSILGRLFATVAHFMRVIYVVLHMQLHYSSDFYFATFWNTQWCLMHLHVVVLHGYEHTHGEAHSVGTGTSCGWATSTSSELLALAVDELLAWNTGKHYCLYGTEISGFSYREIDSYLDSWQVAACMVSY